ncbi:MAG: hypothetical protein ACFCUQ_03955 [Kiloniellales bacterium]
MAGSPENNQEGENPDPLALAAAGWRAEDLQWERLQERAASAPDEQAAPLWAEALRLARANFAANDPRLAASLANQAVALRRAGDDSLAGDLLDEALRIWDAAPAWIESMKPERRARSSTFHLRLESKHRGGYEQFSRERYQALAAEGRAATLALKTRATSDDDRLARWRKDKPAGFTDGRKLMAAALLIAVDD